MELVMMLHTNAVLYAEPVRSVFDRMLVSLMGGKLGHG
jgi:hypothetical protein